MFKEVKASKKSMETRGSVYSVGINDADYAVIYKIENKSYTCPYYLKWVGMLKRCYSYDYKVKHPTYIGCSVSEEWLTFSNFKYWMEKQNWEGRELDKDLMILNNKLYSKDTCLFIPKYINNLFVNCLVQKGDYPLGVYYSKDVNKYRSQITMYNKRTSLGVFNTIEEASEAYLSAKREYVNKLSLDFTSEPMLHDALIARASLL